MADNVVEMLAQRWRAAGVHRGDTILLHSSIKRTARALIGAGCSTESIVNDILDSFLAAVGDEGTLLLPLFNFDFTTGVPFDIRSTPSKMGALTEAGRMRSGAVRTGHPIYSFAALGDKRDLFQGVRNFSGYGADSPFGVLHGLSGRIAVLDLPDQHSMTFYHYVEECEKVNYRYHKRFSGPYVNSNGEASIETFGIFVRDLDRGVLTHVDAMGELLWERNIYAGDRPGEGSGLRIIDASTLYDEVSGIIRAGCAEGLLFRTQGAVQ